MDEFWRAILTAASMIWEFDAGLWEIIGLSLRVSLTATLIAALIGLPLGALIALGRFPGRRLLIVIFNALMGLPPVVVGLIVYLLLSRAGPFGVFNLLFTPTAMVIAQIILVLPIIISLSRENLETLWGRVSGGPALPRRRAGSGAGNPALGRPGDVDNGTAGGFQPRRRRSRRRDDCRRQY